MRATSSALSLVAVSLFALCSVVCVRPVLAAAPSITSLSPTSGAVGASITITGTNFGSTKGSSTVKFNGTIATTTSWSNTSIAATVPTGATTGNVVVTVGGVASNGKSFTVVPAPSITSLSITTGAVGAAVTVTGSNFGSTRGTGTVKFNGTTASVSSWSATSIAVTVPSGATTGNVVVFASGVNSNGVNFTVVPAPSISSLSPTTGAVGASVTISGSNFGSTQGNGTVKCNGTLASVNSWSANSIAVTMPSGATTGNVVVFASGVNSNGKSFTVVPAPSITSLSVTSGSLGTPVTITGTNFGSTQGSGNVKFNGTTASVSSWNATSIHVTVPSGATTGNVVVFASGVNSNGVSFTVVMLNSITVTLPNLSLPVGSPQQYTATGNYSNGTQQNLTSTATWTSSSPSVATIGSTGLATAVALGQTTIHASASGVNGSTPLTVTGPVFLQVGNLHTARTGFTATRLADGRVLVVGGENVSGNQMFASAEIYDPATSTFSPTGSLFNARALHTATLLPNGTVLIAGGFYIDAQNNFYSLSTAEIYDPVSGTFSYANGTMTNGRFNSTATLLNNGLVLIAGGGYYTPSFSAADSELYDPVAQTFTPTTGAMITPRELHTATLLNDGTVLIVGGNSFATFAPTAQAEIYDPVANTFSAAGNLNTATDFHAAALLSSGKVLIAGGYCGPNCTPDAVARTEVYDPSTKLFTNSTSLAIPRLSPTGTMLNNGTVLIVGGQTNSGITGTAEIFDPSTQNITGAGSLVTARDTQTATPLSDGTVLLASGVALGGLTLSAELYAPTPSPPFSLQVTPSTVNMLIGSTQQFTAVSNTGFPRTDATWTVSDQSLASISSGSSPTFTALASGQVTVTATVGSVSAQAQVTILPAGTNPAPGSALWTVPAIPGYTPVQLAQAMPSDVGPDMYSIQTSGAQSVVQALTSDGQQMWQQTFPVLNANSVPDANGGMLVAENQTCNQNQTQPMVIADLNPTTGQTNWQITAQQVAGQYCYPNAPRMAVRPDGSVAVSASGNTSGLPEFMIVSGQNGQVVSAPNIPPSSYQGNLGGGYLGGYSPIGAPIVDSDGNTYVEYEVRTIQYPNEVTQAAVYLLAVAWNGPITTTQLSSTTQDENLFPGRIIPDGQGGVLATWTIAAGSDVNPKPTNPYQAAHVVSGSVTATYNLPFTPTNLITGPDGLPISPSFILGQTSDGIGTDGQSTGDSTNPTLGPKIVSLNLASGSVNWVYQVGTQSALTLIAATSDAGSAVADSVNGLTQVDATGTPHLLNSNALPQSSWNGGNWYTQDSQGVSAILPPFHVDPADDWAIPGGGPSQNGAALAACDCMGQSGDTDSGGGLAPGVQPQTLESNTRPGVFPAAFNQTTCPICYLSPGPPPASCTSSVGTAPEYVLLIGDPGIGSHNVIDLFALAAQTQFNTLASQGNTVVACRVSTIQDVYNALTLNGYIDGGVIYFGHSGLRGNYQNGNLVDASTEIFVGGDKGADTNIASYNVDYLSGVQTSNAGGNPIGPTAALTINGCDSTNTIRGDYWAIQNGWTYTEFSIAELVSNKINRGVYGYDVGMYFGLSDAQHDPWISGVDEQGKPRKVPEVLPMYMVPEGAPGHKPKPLGCRPNAGHCL